MVGPSGTHCQTTRSRGSWKWKLGLPVVFCVMLTHLIATAEGQEERAEELVCHVTDSLGTSHDVAAPVFRRRLTGKGGTQLFPIVGGGVPLADIEELEVRQEPEAHTHVRVLRWSGEVTETVLAEDRDELLLLGRGGVCLPVSSIRKVVFARDLSLAKRYLLAALDLVRQEESRRSLGEASMSEAASAISRALTIVSQHMDGGGR